MPNAEAARAQQVDHGIDALPVAQADIPEFAEFLVREGIESMSLNPDSVVKTLEQVAELEEKLSR